MAQQDRALELRRRLWNRDGAAATGAPGGSGASVTVDAALLEQYRIYVEMADRISQRRSLANTFFLSLNTGIFSLLGLTWTSPPDGREAWLLVPLVAVVAQCFAWYYLVRSYRQLNTAKYEVIGALEERLPASPYWRAEWWALGEGKDRSRYWPLSHIEQWLPILFAANYLAGFAALVVS